MKARLGDTVIADAEESDLVRIEGNWYFPPESVHWERLEESPTPYTCPWKGICQYYTVDGHADNAFSYPNPLPSAIDRVGRDFSGYVAFWQDVQVGD